MTFPGIFLAGDSKNDVFVVVFDFRPEKPNQTEKLCLSQIAYFAA
jgi:hypothetical protein